MHTSAASRAEGCSWCRKEIGLLHKASRFPPEEIQVYVSFYDIFGEGTSSLRKVGAAAGLPDEEAEQVVVEIADWLMANSPYRSLPRRCHVCDHAQGPEDLAHLKEAVS